jgi:uncharacterized HAD superfamily protein
MRRLIGVDLDGVLCEGKCWKSEEECLNAKPIPEMIEIVNKLYKDEFIIIYTARQDWLMSATFQWLHKNGIYFHAVMNGKVPLNIMIDDVAIEPKNAKEIYEY